MIKKLDYSHNFPHPNSANEDGIVAYGGDLNPTRLYKAYREGIFPWFMPGEPILWWSPDPRLILHLDDFKLRKSLKKKMKHFEIRIDANFEKVLIACAGMERPGQNGTWLQPDLIEAMTALNALGKAHSIEAYYEDELVGGLYGVTVGAIFCGESMFAKKSDASKVAFAVLIAKLKEWGYKLVDAQVPTDHLNLWVRSKSIETTF